MPKYRVYLETGASLSVTVDAEDEEAAAEAAFESGQYLCAQCSGWGQNWTVDLGEWDLADDVKAVELIEESDG